MGTFRDKLAYISSNICLRQQTAYPFGHLLCMLCLNGSKQCFYSDIAIKDNNFLNLVRKKCHKILGRKWGTNFSSSGWGKKGVGDQNISKILGGGTNALHTVDK